MALVVLTSLASSMSIASYVTYHVVFNDNALERHTMPTL